MSREALITWIKGNQEKLESVLLTAAQEYYKHNSTKPMFEYDATNTGKEMWLLGRGEDLCYDRPTIGFYSIRHESFRYTLS